MKAIKPSDKRIELAIAEGTHVYIASASIHHEDEGINFVAISTKSLATMIASMRCLLELENPDRFLGEMAEINERIKNV